MFYLKGHSVFQLHLEEAVADFLIGEAQEADAEVCIVLLDGQVSGLIEERDRVAFVGIHLA